MVFSPSDDSTESKTQEERKKEAMEEVSPNEDDPRWICESCGFIHTTSIQNCVECDSISISKRKRKDIPEKHFKNTDRSLYKIYFSSISKSFIGLIGILVFSIVFGFITIFFNLFSEQYLYFGLGLFILIIISITLLYANTR